MIPIKPLMGAVSQWILQPTGMVLAPDDVNIHTRGTGNLSVLTIFLCRWSVYDSVCGGAQRLICTGAWAPFLPLHSVERTELADRHTCKLLHTGSLS